MINYYTVKTGETITDVLLNSTGTIANWEAVLNANNFTDWTPDLYPGQQIIIPDDSEIQNNVLVVTTKYPANNYTGIPNFDDLVSDLITKFGEIWILNNGVWNDGGYWIDSAQWID
jgi:phage tail protein X